MARMVRGILGGLRGKIGNVVGSNWKGIDTLRTLPLSVANPRTAAQVGQRTKFGTIVAIGSQLLVAIIKPLWDRFAQFESGYNAFISANIDVVSTTGVVTYADLKTSQGSLTPGANVAFTSTVAGDEIGITYQDNSGTGTALAADEVYVAMYNVEQDDWVFSSAVDTRADGSSLQIIPSGWVQGNEVHAYLAFRRADGTLVSNSDYVTGSISA